MSSPKIVLIHFAPIEFYPPFQNLLVELNKSNTSRAVVLSTANYAKSKFVLPGHSIEILRLGKSGGGSTLGRYWNYLRFYISALLLLLWHHPNRLLYVETLSSWPVYIYKRFFKIKCEVLIHYHEYTSPPEYQTGMFLSRYFHKCEKWLYPRCTWLSHTNQQRMNLFKKDIQPIQILNEQILPNYPPLSWRTNPKEKIDIPVRVVYVGALSIDTMYVREFAEWVIAQGGRVIWHVYSFNYTPEAKKFLIEKGSPHILFFGDVSYDCLIDTLRKYHVGVILYNGHIPNYVFNAPNKLFEYIACGLDVWFPKEMVGCTRYMRTSDCPKIIPLEYKNLGVFNLDSAIAREGKMLLSEYFCEEALQPLIKKLTR